MNLIASQAGRALIGVHSSFHPLMSCMRLFCHASQNDRERERMDYDVVIVGGGCSGLSAAIEIKKKAEALKKEISVCIIEKGERIGSHIMSGCLMETSALSLLLPNWKEMGAPISQKVKEESMQFFLGQENSITIPKWIVPRNMNHSNSYIVSLSQVCSWLGTIAESKGVDIFTDTGAEGVLYEKNRVAGVYTADRGVDKQNHPKEEYQRGYAIYGKSLILAEGVLGSISSEIIERYQLRKNDEQTYGLGIKEVWEIPHNDAMEGRVIHTVGYPLQRSFQDSLYGGGFLYFASNLLYLGYITGLDYKNTYLSPYEEFQLFKETSLVSSILRKGERLEYGARTIYEGGLLGQSKCCFPGGILIGECLGMMNMASLQGVDNSIRSGIIGGDAVVQEIDQMSESGVNTCYEDRLKHSPCYTSLYNSRSLRASFEKGLWCGSVHAFIYGSLLRNHSLLTRHIENRPDYMKTLSARESKLLPSRDYCKYNNITTWDRENSLSLTNLNYPLNEHSHISIRTSVSDKDVNSLYRQFEGPEERFCPAHVYEYRKTDDGTMKLHINHENCIHCKTCTIKTPNRFLQWKVPGSGGPSYSNM